jgi:hypothetical protein
MMFDSFASLSHRFTQVPVPDDQLPGEWLSPYRLLWGAAYSIGIAERSLAGSAAELVHIPVDLSSSLNSAVHHSDDLPWFGIWHASYMLTSAIFRVAAEKICHLAAPELDDDRQKLWTDAANADSRLSKKVPRAHELLGKQMRMPKRKDRPGYLQAQREEFASSQKVALPLMCAFMQTDRDKHVACSPLKELRFEHVLATNAFLEACDLWGAAVDAERRARSTA